MSDGYNDYQIDMRESLEEWVSKLGEENNVVMPEEMRKVILKRMRSGVSWSPNHGDN